MKLIKLKRTVGVHTISYHITFLLVRAKPSLSTRAGRFVTAFLWLGHQKQKERVKEALWQRALLGFQNSEENGYGEQAETERI